MYICLQDFKKSINVLLILKLHLLSVLSNNVSLEYWYWILVVTSLPSFLFLLCVNYLVYASAFILKDAIHLTVTFFYEHCRYIKEKFVILMKCLINQNHLLISNISGNKLGMFVAGLRYSHCHRPYLSINMCAYLNSAFNHAYITCFSLFFSVLLLYLLRFLKICCI